MATNADEINLGPFLLILVISVVAIRYFFFKPSRAQQQAQRRAADPQATARGREEAAQRILQIFPHVDRRSILWDLQRTGGNVDVTTERILTGRLATPPITFQPPPPPGSNSSNDGAAGQQQSQGAATALGQNTEPDLITRYNLQSKLAESGMDGEKVDKKGKGWSSNKNERQVMLQKRREDMILAARRKMEAKLAAEKTHTASQA